MADQESHHKYIDKVLLPNGKYRYIYKGGTKPSPTWVTVNDNKPQRLSSGMEALDSESARREQRLTSQYKRENHTVGQSMAKGKKFVKDIINDIGKKVSKAKLFPTMLKL